MSVLAHARSLKAPLLMLVAALVLVPLISSSVSAAEGARTVLREEPQGPVADLKSPADGDGGTGPPTWEGDPDDLELTPPIVASFLYSGKYVYLTF